MYYSVFGLKEGASLDELKRAYRENLKKFDNDKNAADELNKAYIKVINAIDEENKKKAVASGTKYYHDRNYNYRERRTGYRGCVRSCCCGCCDSECCDCLTDLWCADTICECMGGDLCECM